MELYIDACAAVDCGFDEDALDQALEARGCPSLPAGDEVGVTRIEVSSEVVLDELLGRLERHEASADVYLPIALPAPFSLGAWRFASLPKLLRALDALRGELEIDAAKESRSKGLAGQRNLWRAMRSVARQARRSRLCLAIVRLD